MRENTHAREKKMHIIEHLGTKGEKKKTEFVYMRKNE